MKTPTPLLTLAGVLAGLVGVLLVTSAREPTPASPPAALSVDEAASPAPDVATAATDGRGPHHPARRTWALPLPAIYAGRDGEVTMAVALRSDGSAVAYVCDGGRLEAWLTGRVRGSQALLAGPDGRFRLARSDTDVSARFWQDGRRWDFGVARAPSARLDDEAVRRLAISGVPS